MMTLIHFSYEKMEAQKLPQGHPARKWQNQDLNLSSFFWESLLLGEGLVHWV